MVGESKCAICGHFVTQLKGKLNNSSPQHRWFSHWKKKCSESLCQVVLGSVTKSFRQYFKTGEYCSSCLQTIRDINLTWSQLKCLEDRLNKLSHAVLQNLKTNYDAIEKKTNPEIVEDRKNFFESYSDDQRIEIIYLVASRHAALSATMVFLDRPIKQDVESFTESEKEEEILPLEIKLEENDKVEYINQSGDGLVNDFEEPPSEYISAERQTILTRKRKIEVKYDHEETSSADEDESDKEYIIPADDFVQSDCESNDSFNPKSSPVKSKPNICASKSKSPPPRKKNKYSKYVKKVKVPASASSTVKCPTCHKTVSRNRFPFHQRIHTGEKPFSCPDCGKLFSDKSVLWKHARLLHGKLNPEGRKIKRPEIAIKVATELASRKRRYYCDICSWDFNYQYRYLRHLKDTHLNKEIKDGDSFFFYYCDVDNCLCSFTSLTSLTSHFLNAHSTCLVNSAAFECNVCKRMFVQENNLQTHMQSHEENNFGCDFCHMTFSSLEEMKNHKHRHEIQFKLSDYCHMCAECGEGFTNTSMLIKHTLKLHKNVGSKKKRIQGDQKNGISRQFFCNICQKGFYKSTLENHMFTHTHPEGFKCSVCPEIRSTPGLLIQHEKNDHKTFNDSALRIKCDICQKMVSKSLLEYHMKSHTTSDSDINRCPHCDTNHKSSKSLQYHLKRVHPQDLLDLPSKFITDSSKTKCEICDKKLSQNKQYHKHLVEYHPEEYEATHPYVCRLCWRVFRTEQDRQFHVEKSHDYKCSIENCGKIFSSRARLLSHLNIHYKQKPHECPYCGKGFAQDGNCRSHINMVHTKHRSFRCKLCPDNENEGYYVRKEFSKHVQNVHPEIPQHDYSSALDYRKAPAPPKIIVSNVTDCYLECPPVKRQSRKP